MCLVLTYGLLLFTRLIKWKKNMDCMWIVWLWTTQENPNQLLLSTLNTKLNQLQCHQSVECIHINQSNVGIVSMNNSSGSIYVLCANNENNFLHMSSSACHWICTSCCMSFELHVPRWIADNATLITVVNSWCYWHVSGMSKRNIKYIYGRGKTPKQLYKTWLGKKNHSLVFLLSIQQR